MTKYAKPHVRYHQDGSVWVKGHMIGEAMVGYWEWFRNDGTRMRSEYFDEGQQSGEWTTYDKKGDVYRVTKVRPKAGR